MCIGIFKGKDKEKRRQVEDYFKKHDLNDLDYVKTLPIVKYELKDLLKTNYKNERLRKEALESQPKATKSRKTIWDKNSQILLADGTMKEIVQTITTKQDRHPNSGNLYFNPRNDGSRYRFLTPRECFLLMGFDEKDYNALVDNNLFSRQNALFFSRDRLYKLAGNSIVVNMLEAIFEQAIDINDLINK